MKSTLVFLSLSLFCLGAYAADEKIDFAMHLMVDSYYIREATDQEWNINISGKIASLCGIYLIVYNKDSKVIFSGTIPHGEYYRTKPFAIKIPKDGVTGDYKVKIIGFQDDYLGIDMPLSNQQEVYYAKTMSMGQGKGNSVIFQTRPDEKQITLSAYKSNLVIKDLNGNTIADTANEKAGKGCVLSKEKYDNCVTFNCEPGKDYVLQSKGAYLGCKNGFFICLNPGTWFLPDSKLEKINWWNLELKK
jgi:hypothetical protein